MAVKTPITIAYGDGIGPEIMSAVLKILEAANAQIETDVIEVGEKVYLQGHTSGIPDSAWESLHRTRVLLKAPITTPQGGGYKSLNVTLRKSLSLFANVRPCFTFNPIVPAKCKKMDMVIIRENEEDMYAGIEYRQTQNMFECLKLISRRGCENIIQYAFEYARKFNRKKITCLTKDNIMKMTDGLFHQVFRETAASYPDIQTDHLIIDIGTALIATQPERFDVIVTENLYGDIISDVAAQVAGSVGLAGSANIGDRMAMFEAIHGSAPDIAGKDIANPSGLLNAAIQMLIHINQPAVATVIENAWLRTLEDGIHTADIYSAEHSTKKVGTQEFAAAVIERLGQKPRTLRVADYQEGAYTKIQCYEKESVQSKKDLVGVDIYIDNHEQLPMDKIAEKVNSISSNLKLNVINSLGLKIWPSSVVETPSLGHCCLRFTSQQDLKNLTAIKHEDILKLLSYIDNLGLDVIKTENLYTFDGKIGFTLGQGQ